MFLAPQPILNGYLQKTPGGAAGVYRTIATMRCLIDDFKTNVEMRQIATTIVFNQPQKNRYSEAAEILRVVQRWIRYTPDVLNVETISTPLITWHGRIGDCDDFAVLIATLLECVGFETRLVATGYSVPGALEHVFAQALISGEWTSLDGTEYNGLGWEPPNAVTTFFESV